MTAKGRTIRKVMGLMGGWGEGNFRAAGTFFRYQIEFFLGHSMNIF